MLGTATTLPPGWALVQGGQAVSNSAQAVSLEHATVERAAAGDANAQSWLARRVLPKIRRVARALCRSSADADDAAQMSLLEVLRSAKTYRGDAGLDAWAGRIAVRTTMRHLRRERRKSEAVVEPPATLAAPVADDSMAQSLPRGLEYYLDALPLPQRTAVVLHHALGYALQEIAGMEDASPNTIKSRLRLGMATIRKQVRRDQAIGARTGEEQP